MALGVAVMLAVVLGVATTALGATGGNFILGKGNLAASVTELVGNVAGGPAMQISNPNQSRRARGRCS